jgi:hypothetical protein
MDLKTEDFSTIEVAVEVAVDVWVGVEVGVRGIK